MSYTTTATLLPSVISDQIDYIIDQLVELQMKFQQEELSVKEFTIKSEEYYFQLETLREQQANW